MVFIGFLFPEAFMDSTTTGGKNGNDAAWNLLLTLAYAPFEAFVLYAFGTTVGKALHGIRLRHAGGPSLPLGSAVNRAFSVWFKGMGMGIPLITLITMAVAHNRLTKKGKTSWD
jgi:hypothetical protein